MLKNLSWFLPQYSFKSQTSYFIVLKRHLLFNNNLYYFHYSLSLIPLMAYFFQNRLLFYDSMI